MYHKAPDIVLTFLEYYSVLLLYVLYWRLTDKNTDNCTARQMIPDTTATEPQIGPQMILNPKGYKDPVPRYSM